MHRNQNLLIWKDPKPSKHTMYKQTTDTPPNLKTPATMHRAKCAIYVQLVSTVTIDIIMVNKCGSKCVQTGGKHHNGPQNPLWPWTYIYWCLYIQKTRVRIWTSERSPVKVNVRNESPKVTCSQAFCTSNIAGIKWRWTHCKGALMGWQGDLGPPVFYPHFTACFSISRGRPRGKITRVVFNWLVF